MKVEVVSKGNQAFFGRAPDAEGITMDLKKEAGGDGTGPTPLETLLLALGGCVGLSIGTILAKMRCPPSDFRVELEAERRDEAPNAISAVKARITVSGEGITPSKLERAIKLMDEEFCSVSASLDKAIKIEYSYVIL